MIVNISEVKPNNNQSDGKSSQTSKYFKIADLEQNICGIMKFIVFYDVPDSRWISDQPSNAGKILRGK